SAAASCCCASFTRAALPLRARLSCWRSAAPRALHSFPTRRSSDLVQDQPVMRMAPERPGHALLQLRLHLLRRLSPGQPGAVADRSEEHTSELQSREKLVCRLLLEKKNDKPT